MIANSSDNGQLNIAIVGGGIGGLCLAIGLIKHPHVNVQIYEAAQAFSEIGAGLTINTNARRALKLLDPGLERALLKLQTGNSPEFAAEKNTYCRFVWGAGPKAGQQITKVWCEDGQQSVHRAHFLDELVKLVPPEICHFNKRLTTIEEQADGQVTLNFADDTSAAADCVVGADGVHSSVRKHMVPEGDPSYHPTYSQFAGYRGLIPMDKARAALGDELSLIATMHVAPGALLMSYPIDFHKQLNIVAVDGRMKEWRGEAIQPADPDKMAATFAGWTPAVRTIIDLIQGPAAKIWSLWQIPGLSSFVRSSRVALLGDAAHAMVPFHAQGAAQAIEDALVLANLLGRKVRSQQDLQHALRAYDQIRRPRAQQVVKDSHEGGTVFTMQHPGILDDEALFKDNVEVRYDWIINRDMQLQVDQALMIAEDLKVAAATQKTV